MNWVERAACRDHPYPDLWFAGGAFVSPHAHAAATRAAVELCQGCPVIAECAAHGIEREAWGVWGGLTRHQRRDIRRKRREAVAV